MSAGNWNTAEMVAWKNSEGTRLLVEGLKAAIEDAKQHWLNGALVGENEHQEIVKMSFARGGASYARQILDLIDEIRLPDEKE